MGRKGSFGKVTWTEVPGFCIDTAYYIDRRHTGANLRWLYWALQTLGLDVHSEDTGVPGLSREKALQSRLQVPALGEQERIANFLDEQTARIDALIAEKEKLRVTVSELRHAAITEAVAVPASPGWKQTRLKYLVHDIVDTEHKTVPFYDDGEYLVARTTNIKSGGLVFEGAKYTDAAGFEEWTRRARPAPGDLLFTREAPAGEACIVPAGVPLCLGQRTVLIRLRLEKADPEFVLWSLYGGLSARFIADLSQGSTVVHFNMPDIANIPLFSGPLEEQRQRAQVLKLRLAKIDLLDEHVELHVDRLREYRSSLISEAVTGQLELDDKTNTRRNERLAA